MSDLDYALMLCGFIDDLVYALILCGFIVGSLFGWFCRGAHEREMRYRKERLGDWIDP